MVDTANLTPVGQPSIYAEIGVPTIINGRGATTAVGGTLMRPEVLVAMAEAAGAFVVLDDLNAEVGGKIAEMTGMAAGCVTSGSAAGMALAAAACIAGADPERIRRLPDSDGMPNEIVVHRSHRLNYDQMYRLAGARLVEIGVPYETERWELERAITERTAAIAYVDSRNVGPGALPFATVVEIARARGVPTIVDAASTVPPLSHLHCWSGWGADLVIFSGGKGIRGPQDSGLLAGRANLIAAARANGSPNSGIGRGMKVSKEAMAGLWKALDLFQLADHAADFAAHLAQADVLCDALGSRPDLWTAIEGDWADRPAPVVRVFPQRDAWSPEAVRRDLMRPAPGTPAIHVDVQRGGLQISTHCLLPGQELVIARRLGEILGPGQ